MQLEGRINDQILEVERLRDEITTRKEKEEEIGERGGGGGGGE